MLKIYKNIPKTFSIKTHFDKNKELLYLGNVLRLLDQLPNKKIFDLVVTSPPYNIGKKDDRWQLAILDAKELEFINFEDKDEHGHHWQTFELLMNAFEENFKETNYSTTCD